MHEDRPIAKGGDAYGTHRSIEPRATLPQPAWRLDNDFSRLFEGEMLIDVETLNVDAASFTQIDETARARGAGASLDAEIARIIERTVADRGKQHNPVTGSGGMLLGRVAQVAPGRTEGDCPRAGDRVATLVSLSLTPLRIDRVRSVRRASAQVDVEGQAVLFASGAYAKMPADLPERLALSVLDVAGAPAQVARLVGAGDVVAVLGAGGKSGILCAAEAKRRGACVVGLESMTRAADELRALGFCESVVVVDARDPIAVRREVLAATGGREADITFSCVDVADVEMSAILATRDGGTAYFFAMSTSFTKAALGAEGVSRDVRLFIGNGFAHGHAEHTLAMLREFPAMRALFERRYG